MEIITFHNCNEYLAFSRKIYENDPFFKDNKSGLMKVICNKKGAFYHNSTQIMIGVKDKGDILCQCVLINHKNKKEHLCIAFFEAKINSEQAVSYMMDYASSYGKSIGCSKLIVSLDGHCNHSVGFLNHEKNDFPSFGASYQPNYYHNFFIKDFEQVNFISYKDQLESVYQTVLKCNSLFPQDSNVQMECADMSTKGFQRTMQRYTDLNNAIFHSHRYYFKRSYLEDMELFQSMKPLLNPDNLIFAVKDGKDIGFILWYPDFNELVKPKKEASISMFISYRLFKKPIRTIKVVEIGVLPKHHGSETIIRLFHTAIEHVIKSYPSSQTIISSWILEENMKSKQVTHRFLKNIEKRFAAYEKKI